MFDAEGNINSCNRSAEALFGYDGDELVQRNLADLFAPESQRVVRDYLESIKGAPASPACSITAATCWAVPAGAASSRCR